MITVPTSHSIACFLTVIPHTLRRFIVRFLLFIDPPSIGFHLWQRHCRRCNLVFLCCYLLILVSHPPSPCLHSLRQSSSFRYGSCHSHTRLASFSFSLFSFDLSSTFLIQTSSKLSEFFVCWAAISPSLTDQVRGCLPSRGT